MTTHTIRNVPIPANLADELTRPGEMTKWGTYCYPLEYRGHDLGHYKVISLRAEWDDEAQQMRTVVDLVLVGKLP
jgi:hypothetical protein